MNAPTTTALLALVATAPVMAPGRSAQSPTPSLFRGWILESIGADRAAVGDDYRNIVADAATSREMRTLALARLVEIDRLDAAVDRQQRDETTLEQLVPGVRRLPAGDFAALRAAFADALAMPAGSDRDRRLGELRAELARADAAASLPVRGVVVTVVRAMTQERSDLERRLERELTEADAAGNRARVVELRHRLREISGKGDSRKRLERWVGSWRVRVTRLLAEGELDEAERIRRHSEPNAVDQPVPADLDKALSALAELQDRQHITAAERDALRELHARMDEAHRAGGDDEVRATLARLPYALR